MQRNEPFNPDIKSTAASPHLIFRMAKPDDREAIIRLMAERNPTQNISEVATKTDREIALNSSDSNYRVFVAELQGQVVGLCRYFHSSGLPKEKVLFPSPEGWYCMGIVVDSGMRRRGIARFLFQNRLQSLSDRGAKLIYSMVAEENLASIRMHQEFGFQEIERGPGFLNVKFDAPGGIFYQRKV